MYGLLRLCSHRAANYRQQAHLLACVVGVALFALLWLDSSPIQYYLYSFFPGAGSPWFLWFLFHVLTQSRHSTVLDSDIQSETHSPPLYALLHAYSIFHGCSTSCCHLRRSARGSGKCLKDMFTQDSTPYFFLGGQLFLP